ncbi:MAG: TraB/GumN family protein [Ruminococcus sp.]|nr:TraB/GumN family protein [Ruminococcus sp.]
MKKTRILAAACALLMLPMTFASCGDKKEKTESRKDESSAAVTEESSEAPEEPAPEESEAADDSSQAEPEEQGESTINPPAWKLTTPSGKEVILVGSMHALSEEDYPMPDELLEAYDKADVVAFECDINKTDDEANKLVFSTMYLIDGSTFSDHISPEAYEALSAYLDSYDLEISSFEMFAPYAVASLVDELAVEYSELSRDLGIDQYFLDKCYDDGKEIYEVESVYFQTEMLINYSEEIYDLLFREFDGEDKDSVIENLYELHDAWVCRDLATIEGLEDEDDEEELSEEDQALIDEYNKVMVDDRNIGMAEAIEEFAEGDQQVLFIVGAAHYVGEKGIIALLEADGYEPVPLEYKNPARITPKEHTDDDSSAAEESSEAEASSTADSSSAKE